MKIRFIFVVIVLANIVMAGCGGGGSGTNPSTINPITPQLIGHTILTVSEDGSNYTTDNGVPITSSTQLASPVTITIMYGGTNVGDIVAGPQTIAFTSSDPKYTSVTLTASKVTDQFGTVFYNTYSMGTLYRGAYAKDVSLKDTELVMFLGTDKKSQSLATEVSKVLGNIVTF